MWRLLAGPDRCSRVHIHLFLLCRQVFASGFTVHFDTTNKQPRIALVRCFTQEFP